MAFALKRFKGDVDRMPFMEFIGWLKYDRAECIGPERHEWMMATAAMSQARMQGADVDIYHYLEQSPWNKIQRPMPTDAQLIAQIENGTGRNRG